MLFVHANYKISRRRGAHFLFFVQGDHGLDRVRSDLLRWIVDLLTATGAVAIIYDVTILLLLYDLTAGSTKSTIFGYYRCSAIEQWIVLLLLVIIVNKAEFSGRVGLINIA